MTIRQLKKFPGPPEQRLTPPCCAEVQTTPYQTQWRIGRGEKEPFTCSRPSVVEIDGRSYCRLHGGHVTLDMFLDGRLAQKERDQ